MRLKSRLLRRGLLIGSVFLFFIAGNALGATYYVAPTGSDSNPGTQAKPWAHPQKCADNMVGGDTCIVKDGTYDDKNGDKHVVNIKAFSGASSSKWVTFQAENTGGAVIDGKNSSASGRGFLLTNSAYVRIIGFEIKRVLGGIKMQTSHDIYIENCEIHELGRHYSVDQESAYPPCPTTATAARVYSGIAGKDDSYNITVKNCNLYDIGKAHVQPEGTCWRDFLWDHAIYALGKGWLIENCKIWDVHSGWHIKLDGHTGASSAPTHIIRNCEFYGNHGGSAFKKSTYMGQITVTQSHGDSLAHDFVIENCLFSEPEQGIALSASDYIDLRGAIFRNNRNTGSTLYAGGSGQPALSGNIMNAAIGLRQEISQPRGFRIAGNQ